MTFRGGHYNVYLELEAILQCCSLVEYEVVWCRVRILEEVADALELDCNT